MRSSSTTCAQILYDIIQSKLTTAFSFEPGSDSLVADEILTVLTLAANHPAFVFDQRQRLFDHLCFLDSQRRASVPGGRERSEDDIPLDLYTDNHIPHYSVENSSVPINTAALCNRHSPATQSRKVCVCNIEVRGHRKGAEKKVGPEYVIRALWSNGEITEVSKRFREIQNFHQQMIEMFPDEKPPNGRIPSLPAGSSHQHANIEEHIAEKMRTLAAYFRFLTELPSHILESEHVCQFFKGVLIPQAQQSPMIPPTLSYQQPDDTASRIPRFMPPPHPHHYYIFPQRFPTSLPCQTVLMSAHQLPVQQQQQQQQPSPVSPPHSERSSTTNSPVGSRSASPDPSMSVPHLLKQFGLEKYVSTLGTLSFEQLWGLTCEDLSKFGLAEDVPDIQMKLAQLKRCASEKQTGINGLVDNMVYPSFSLSSPSSPSSIHFVPTLSFTQPRMGFTAPRSGTVQVDSSTAALSDIASGGSPPVSPSAIRIQQGGLLGKAPPGDSSEGSEDLERDKSDAVSDTGKNMSHQQTKSAQVKVSPGGNMRGGGSSSPRPPSANSRMTPPDETAVKQPLLPLQAVPPTFIPYFYPPTPAPPGLMGQYIDPKGEVGMMGVVHNTNNNTNNNYTTEAIPIMSTGIPHRPALLQAGVGPSSVRPPFKTGQPQPAHTNMNVLHGKSLITMPAEPKPGSPVIPFVNLRPEMQTAIGQGGASPQMEGGAQRMSMYHLSYGRGQAGPVASGHVPPVHLSQPGAFSFPLVTRSVHTSLPGSASVMTVSASNPITAVTASHSSATTATSVHRSPSHSGINSNGQRDSGNESASGGASMQVTDASMQSPPPQVVGGGVTVTQVAAAPSPPVSNNSGCQVCAQGTQYSHNQYGHVPYNYPPFLVPQGPNGLIPLSAMSGYYSTNQPLAAGVLANGFASDMYPYTHPAYPGLNPSTGHIYPMMHGNALYQGTASQPGMSTGPASSGVSMVPPQSPASGTGLAAAGQQASSVGVKQRNTGCYNCGSLAHRAADCHESSMETMSGKSVYSLDFRPAEESD